MLLPAPMLARSGPLPTGSGYAFELKCDGFRAIVRTGSEFEVRSRRGWNMTALLPELREMPVNAVLDGELVALGADGWPHFPLVCDRLLNGKKIPLVYVVFDVLELDGQSAMHLPYRERRRLLEGLALDGPRWQTSETFDDDGAALFKVAEGHGLEGVFAKRLTSPYRSRERGWIKATSGATRSRSRPLTGRLSEAA